MPTITSSTTTIRVVDPRPDDYSSLAAASVAAAYQILYATSGDEALRLPKRSAAGLWLINFDLPDMTGPELFALVRCCDPLSACALVSNVYSASEELSARQLGATLYGCKPPQAGWLHAMPVFRRPCYREHLAHGPPGEHGSPGSRATPAESPVAGMATTSPPHRI